MPYKIKRKCIIMDSSSNSCYTSMSGLPDMYTRNPRAAEARGLRVDISGRPQVPVLQLLCNTSFTCNWLHYIFIVVLITFDCGFELWCLFYVFNTSTIVSATQRYSFCRHYKLFTYCIEPSFVGWLYERCTLFKTYLKSFYSHMSAL